MPTSQTEPLGGTGGGVTRTRNRWGEGQKLRQEILEAAKRLLDEARSPDEISLRAIAREAGITAPSVYKHFKDKSELMWAVLDGIYIELAETMRAAAQTAPGGDSWAALRATVDGYGHFAVQQRPRYQLMFHIGPMLSDPPATEQYPYNHVANAWREVLEPYLADMSASRAPFPQVASLEVDDVAALLWTGLHGQFGLWWSVSHEFPRQHSYDKLRDTLLLTLFGRC
ncbi:TetR/AcrR family transcriptional regulator [Streptomyces chartreusis]|uniref:TetR/AcrR family transcriptional regulator n=1 Tax=Streptomyces chartreusis TaxID=1969 RepID=UPI0036C327C1